MYTKLADETLKASERLEVGVVLAPDEAHAGQIKPFLGHKQMPYKWHIEKSVHEPLGDLETRYYIGKVNGAIICNIMTVESHRTGILGHVYTLPDHRRKGACDAVMKHQMEDFRQRGGGLMFLGTGFERPPYWIYHRHGFRSVLPGTGHMRYASEGDFEAKYFARGASEVVEVRWHDWPRVNALCSTPGPEVVRGMAWGILGQSSFEGGFLNFKRALETDGRTQARILESERGAVVGFASIAPDGRWRGSVCVLDCFAHANHSAEIGRLIEALPLPPGKVQAYADANSTAKIAALRAAGFEEEARLGRQVAWGEECLDVLVMSKFV
jgi:hypothetical protein